MSLSSIFHRASRKIGLGLCALTLAFTMAGCGYPAHELGQDPTVPVSTMTEVMFQGAGAQAHATVDGASLQSKNAYNYTGSVTIRGDVPANTEINVEGGRLEITGNVGDGAKLTVHMPVHTHSESYTYTTFMMVGKVMIPMTHTGTHDVEDGLAFPQDQHAAVKVGGAIGNKVTVSANGGIEAGAWGTEFKAETGWGRTLQQVLPRGPSS
jgi:hypothetical protein